MRSILLFSAYLFLIGSPLRASESAESESVSSTDGERKPIAVSPADATIVVDKPTEEQLSEILERAYREQEKFLAQMKHFIVGIKGQDSLKTLDEAFKEKLISPE